MPDKENDATRLWEFKITAGWLILLLCMFTYSCTPKNAITPKGIDIARLGKEMPIAQNPYYNFPTRDTIFEGNGYKWPAMIVETNEGQVWIEGDFLDGKTINRLRIETPAYIVKRKIRTGSRLADLEEVGKTWEVLILREYGKVDILCKGIHFLVDIKAIPAEVLKENPSATYIDPAYLDRNAIIEAIVVF